MGPVTRTLQEELNQTRPFELLEEEVYLSVVRTAAVLERQLARFLKPYGLTPTQYNVLRILRGSAGEGLCRNEVGARLVREVPDVTRLLDRMKQMRLIRRQRADSDRRMVRTLITQKGLDVLAELDLRMRKAHRDRVAHVSPQKLRALVDTLAEVRSTET
jgi:DNA-binding MarR family transcriptional regulator